jgi:DNA polymerase eta
MAGDREEKRRRLEDTGIQRYLDRKGIIDEQDDDFGAPQLPGREALVAEVEDADSKESGEATPTLNVPRNEATSSLEMNTPSTGSSALHQHHITDYTCSRCNVGLKSGEALQSHQDWHFARDLQDQDERRELHGKKLPTNTGKRKAGQSSSRKTGGGSKSEKGQSKLSFG